MKKKPRILMIAPLPPPVHGSAMMTQYIKDSRLINDALTLDWINLSTSRKMDEIGKRSPTKIFRFAGSYIKTFWKLLTHRYEACYIALTCHGVGFLKDAPFAILCKLFGHKLIIHQHNKGMSRDVDKPLYNRLFKVVYKNATVILLSWRLYPDIEKVVRREQVRIIPNGIPQTKVYPKNEKPHVPQLLFLSNLIESKGVFVLLDACKILKDEGYIFNCNFVGGETKEIDAKRFAEEVHKRGLDEKVVYLGRKYGEEKDQQFAKSDIFVFPTFYENETFGLVLLEAMQQATPVIGSDEGGIPDIIEHGRNGLIAKRKDARSVAENICMLIDDPVKSKSMGINGQLDFLKKYTITEWEQLLLSDIQAISGGGYVNFLGRKYGEEKDRQFAKSDIFVFPTYYENECFPLVLLEAMRAGVPVISTDEGAISDIISDDIGILCHRQSITDLVRKLKIYLSQNTDLYAVSKRSIDIFKSQYEIAIFENNIYKVLRQS